MIIDTKVAGIKSYLNENRMSHDGLKTSIDQAAITPNEQNNVDLELKDSTKEPQDNYKEKKKQNNNPQNKEEKEDKPKKQFQTQAEAKSRNLKLLNLL